MKMTSFLLAVTATAVSAAFTVPKRPVVVPAPYNTGRDMPPSPPRDPNRICRVWPGCKPVRDDGPKIKAALEKCNNGGTVVLDKSYLIASPLNLTFLKHIDVAITGEIRFHDDVPYWQQHAFKFKYQDSPAFWVWGGEDVNIFGDLSNGKSLIHGQGQRFWEEFAKNKTLVRPILFITDELHGATMSNLRMRNSPNWFNLIANSTDIVVSNIELTAGPSENGVKIGNTDGWDTYRSSHVVIQDSIIHNTDDCVSFKPNSSEIVVQNLDCTGSHGISVGSLGQYRGVVDIVENLFIYNTTMANASDGARIKVWGGAPPNGINNQGGGLGRVQNVTWDRFYHNNNDRAITITQCYNTDTAVCNEYPSTLTMDNINLKNFWGQTSAAFDPEAGALICSSPSVCTNIRAENIKVTVPSGQTPVYKCRNLDKSLVDFECKDV